MRRGPASMFLHAGLLLTSIVLAAWIVRRTALEPERTAHVADAVLDSPHVRQEITNQVAARISAQTGTASNQVAPAVDDTLQQDGVARMLADTVTAAHRRLLDPQAPAPVIGTGAMNV